MRTISRRTLSKWELILASLDRLVTGEHYTMTTGKNIGDLDSALDAWVMLTKQHLGIDSEDLDQTDVTPTLTIKHSNKLPVTMINPSSGNDRVIRYCVVKAYKRNPLLGRITVNGKSHKVTRRILSNGQYSQWELI